MILRVIHPLFKLDLEDKGLTLIEENSWFTDKFFAKYTYPFDFEITDELDAAMGHITSIQRKSTESVFDVIFLAEGNHHQANLLVDTVIGRRVSPSISYGLEELPNWNKKLADLPLMDFTPAITIYDLAESQILQSWPEVNFNFPQVFPPEGKYDTDSDQWAYFEGIINNRVGSAFLQNEYDTENDIQINRNVIQPMPYLLYVLQVAFLDAGFTLEGDILEDPELVKTVLVSLSEFYTTISADAIQMTMNADEYYDLREVIGYYYYTKQYAKYEKVTELLEPGRYVVAGNIIVRPNGYPTSAYLEFNGTKIFTYEALNSSQYPKGYEEKYFTIEETIEVFFGETGELKYTSDQFYCGVVDGELVFDALSLDLSITKITKYNSENVAQPTLLTPSEVKLNRCVPDMTVGEFFTAIRNYRNYGLTTSGTRAIVNKIEKDLYSRPKVDLRDFEVREPRIKNHEDRSYLLKFQDLDNELFDHPPVYVDRSGANTQGYVTKPDTTTITINLLPMPNNTLSGVTTAQLLTDDQSKLQIAMYGGTIGGKNVTEDPRPLGLISSYDNFYKNWLTFRLATRTLEWTFKCIPEVSRLVTAYSEIQAYNSRFIPERVSKKIISKDEVEITFEIDKLI